MTTIQSLRNQIARVTKATEREQPRCPPRATAETRESIFRRNVRSLVKREPLAIGEILHRVLWDGGLVSSEAEGRTFLETLFRDRPGSAEVLSAFDAWAEATEVLRDEFRRDPTALAEAAAAVATGDIAIWTAVSRLFRGQPDAGQIKQSMTPKRGARRN